MALLRPLLARATARGGVALVGAKRSLQPAATRSLYSSGKAGSNAGAGAGAESSSGSTGSSKSGLFVPVALSSSVALAAGYLLSKSTSSPSSAVSHSKGSAQAVTAQHPEYNFEAGLSELQKIFPADRLSVDPSDLEEHGHSDWSYHPSHPHSCVIWPTSTEEVVQVVKIAAKSKIPLVPFAGGTSLEAHFSAPDPVKDGRKSISLDFSMMDQILRLSEEDGDVTVQPGVKWEELNEELKERGSNLFFPIDPGPSAAVGGMAACGCSGTNAVRYGTMKDNYVLNLTVVLPSGEVITTRARSRKSSAGPDLTKIFLGSEGTLGITVAATLRLAPRMPETAVGVSSFASAHDACAAARDMLAKGINVQCVELLDDVALKCVNKANETDSQAIVHEEKPSLFIKFAGSTKQHIDADSKLTAELLAKNGGSTMKFARDPEEIDRLWKARKVALWSAIEYHDEKDGPWRCWTTDVCVPIGHLPELIKRVKEDVDKANVFGPFVGHVGDGNFHALLIFREGDDEMFKRVESVVHRMIGHAQELDGTCSGEHGIGIGKKFALTKELGEGTVELLKRLKREIDPDNIMNPGKLVDAWD